MAIDFGQIGNALGGVGASLQGRGLEFAKQQNDQRRQGIQDAQSAEMFGLKKQQINDERTVARQKTLFTDAAAAQVMFKNQDYAGILKLGESRLRESKNFEGVNFDITQQVVDLTRVCLAGDQEGCDRLGKTIDNGVEVGVIHKILDEPEEVRPRIIKGGDVSSTGQITTQDPLTGEFTATDVKGFKPDERRGRGDIGSRPTANMQDWKEFQRLKKTDPEGAKAFGLKVGFVKPDGHELSVHLQKRLSSANDKANESEANVATFNGLAAQFEDLKVGGGLFEGSWSESFKDVTGNQDAITNLRKRYASIRGSQVVNNLPPGAASDTDIKLALAGFPSDNATGKQVSSFLRGLAKIEQKKAEFNFFKAEYISDKGNEKGMVRAWREQQSNRPASEVSDSELSNRLGL